MSSTDGRIPLFERDGFIICFEANDETDSIKSNFKNSGLKKSEIATLERRLGQGQAVWFQATVSAWRDGVCLAEEHLGGCYYDKFESFYRAKGDYFDDMADAVIRQAKFATTPV